VGGVADGEAAIIGQGGGQDSEWLGLGFEIIRGWVFNVCQS
jgi:hypothetical protein